MLAWRPSSKPSQKQQVTAEETEAQAAMAQMVAEMGGQLAAVTATQLAAVTVDQLAAVTAAQLVVVMAITTIMVGQIITSTFISQVPLLQNNRGA